MNTPEEQADVHQGGIRAFAFCEDMLDAIESVWNTVKFVLEPSRIDAVPAYLERDFIDFMKGAMGRDFDDDPELQRVNQRVDIDPDLVQSGDFLATARTDGLNALIMYATGSAVGHSAMALRVDGELYIVESEDPVITRTPWNEWIDKKEAADYGLVWHRLSAERRALFDE